jgi:hypothetical protein
LLLAAGSLGGAIFYRRRVAARRERVDVYFDDGSMRSFAEGSPEAADLLPVAHRLIETARAGG